MRLSDYYSASGARVTGITLGLFWGCLVGLFAGWAYGVLCGAAIAVLVALLMPLLQYVRGLPYERIKKTIQGPFLLDEQVLFRSPRGAFRGGFVLTECAMVLFTVKGERLCMQLSREDVRAIRLEDDGALRIFLNDTQYVCVLCGAAEEIFELLGQHGWSTAMG